jgi:hypothetical protein
MSKVKENKSETKNTVVVEPAPAVHEKLADIDIMSLELAKSRRQVALSDAKTALANNENAELSYKYVVLQIYMKYGLSEKDAINESGEILRGGAVQSAQGNQ